jgi:tetratricopeptide (TPR) repeat protein
MNTSTLHATPNTQQLIRRQIGQGFELLHRGQQAQAMQLCQQLLAAHPAHAEVLYLASEVQLAGGEVEVALDLLTRAIAAAPGQLPLLARQINHLLLLRRRRQAKATADAALALAGNDPQALWSVGALYSKCDDPARARKVYEQALAAGCSDSALLYSLATSCLYLGDFDAADQYLQTLLTAAPKHGLALHLRSSLRKQTPQHNHVEDLRARLSRGFDNDAARAACLYALAKELEDIGEADASFAALSEGAALKRRGLQYDLQSEIAAMQAIATHYTREVMEQPNVGYAGEGAIFIVGMPRTGTTLVERMLGRHAQVCSVGELLDFGRVLASETNKVLTAKPALTPTQASLQADFAALGRDYLRGAREAGDDDAVWLVDKMPINFMYCGMIRKALPKAKIIHLVRDPMDSCYAIYKTLFNQAYHFSYQLDELADYYAAYHQLMRHWQEVMPGQILDVHYEELVSDTEGQARRLLQWCGLSWHDDVLNPADNEAPATTASAAQVRGPVHTESVQKWRRYAKGLAPLLERLQAAGIGGN